MTLPSGLVACLEAVPPQFEMLFRQAPTNALRWEPQSWEGIPGERFCLADQACHLRDIEIDGYHVRIRRTLEEIQPDLVSFDSYALANDRHYERQDPNEAIRQFITARQFTVAMVKSLGAHQLARRATFGEYGHVSLLGIIRFLCSHDQQHLACMHWLLGQIESRPSIPAAGA